MIDLLIYLWMGASGTYGPAFSGWCGFGLLLYVGCLIFALWYFFAWALATLELVRGAARAAFAAAYWLDRNHLHRQQPPPSSRPPLPTHPLAPAPPPEKRDMEALRESVSKNYTPADAK
jgi:hypothetical protein